MTVLRMDNVLVVVEDLPAAIGFFTELGLELEGQTTVEGEWAGRVIGLEGVKSEIALMRTPDGHGKVELSRFITPAARPRPERGSEHRPVNTPGIGRIMFTVVDLDEVLGRLRAMGAELVGEVVQYENIYRLCYVRGPEGIVIGLAEELGSAPG